MAVDAPWPFWMGVVAGILLTASAMIVILGGLSGKRMPTVVKRTLATVLLVVSVGVYVVWLVWAIWEPHDSGQAGDTTFVGRR